MNSNALYLFHLPIIALFIVSGSALSGDKNASNPYSTAVFKLTSSDIRSYHPGNAVNYTSIIAGSGVAITGQLKQSINNTVTNPSGKKCLEHTLSATYAGVGGPTPLTIRLLYHQDKQNSLYECGYYDNKTSSYVFISDTANTPGGIALSIQSPMKIGNTTTNLIAYSNSTWKDCTRSVQSIENVETAIGTFEAYKIAETCSSNADSSYTSAESWFVPSLYTIKESGVGEIIAGDFVINHFDFD